MKGRELFKRFIYSVIWAICAGLSVKYGLPESPYKMVITGGFIWLGYMLGMMIETMELLLEELRKDGR